MNYNELKTMLTERKIKVSDFSAQLKMTRQGLQRSLDSEMLPSCKVVICCKLLGMTPNEFFGWEETEAKPGVYASNISGINTQNSNEAIKALKDQLKEKDKQIGRLLTLLEKGSEKETYPSLAADVAAGYKHGKGEQ